MGEALHIEGVLRIYEVPPELLDKNFVQKWWRHVTKKGWKYLTLDDKAREGKLVVEEHNLVTNAGRTQLLAYIGTNAATTPFAAFYAVGTGILGGVQASDTALGNELFRAVPSSFTIVGNGVTITTQFNGTQAVGVYTEAALFGGAGVSSTRGSGVMLTHLLYSYTKGSTPVFNDYALSLT